jgi:hypothetical protein
MTDYETYNVPKWCVPKRKVSDDASLGRGVPWMMRPLDETSLGRDVSRTRRPLDDASLRRDVPWMIHPLDDVSLTDGS